MEAAVNNLIESIVRQTFFSDPVFKTKFLTPELKHHLETKFLKHHEPSIEPSIEPPSNVNKTKRINNKNKKTTKKTTKKKKKTFPYDKGDITTPSNCFEEREYDEIKGRVIYGWNKYTLSCVYKPKPGLLSKPPNYRWAGKNWKTVLLERFTQQSDYGGDPDLELNDFTGTFQNSIINQRTSTLDKWLSSETTDTIDTTDTTDTIDAIDTTDTIDTIDTTTGISNIDDLVTKTTTLHLNG